jgi:hypothetical protein
MTIEALIASCDVLVTSELAAVCVLVSGSFLGDHGGFPTWLHSRLEISHEAKVTLRLPTHSPALEMHIKCTLFSSVRSLPKLECVKFWENLQYRSSRESLVQMLLANR